MAIRFAKRRHNLPVSSASHDRSSRPRKSAAHSPKPGTSTIRPEFTVSWTTIFRVVFTAAVILLSIQLGRLIALIFFALLLSLALWKIVQVAVRLGLPKGAGIAAAALTVVALLTGLVAFVVPAVANQGSQLVSRLPEVQKQIIDHLPANGPVRDVINKTLESASFSDPQPIIEKFMAWGTFALTSLSEFLIILVIAIYFLIDGERIQRWLLAFFSESHRSRAETAAPQIVEMVSRYVGGQCITSLCAGCYAFAVLYFLKVPNAALLAVMAAAFDILPVIGFFLFVIPAVGLAFTVSPLTAGLAAALYAVYHLIETYLIVPKVYGNQLKLSTLTVLVACMAGWLLGGVLGAIAILPVVASYPIIEKLWLQPILEPTTVAEHEAIEEAEHPAAA